MMMTEACIHVADTHDLMPILLEGEDWQVGSMVRQTMRSYYAGPIPSRWWSTAKLMIEFIAVCLTRHFDT
jgi:hypothetical protein